MLAYSVLYPPAGRAAVPAPARRPGHRRGRGRCSSNSSRAPTASARGSLGRGSPSRRARTCSPVGSRTRSAWPSGCGRSWPGSASAAVLTLVLALLTGLASPVAGLFLGLGALAKALSGVRRRRKRGQEPRERGAPVTGQKTSGGAGLAVLVLLCAVVPPGVLSALFPEGGAMPFDLTSYLPCLGVSLLFVVALPREETALRVGAVLYGLLATAAFVFDSPIGGNIARLGALFAGPVLAAAVLWAPRRRALAGRGGGDRRAAAGVVGAGAGGQAAARRRRPGRPGLVLPPAAALPRRPAVAHARRDPAHPLPLGGHLRARALRRSRAAGSASSTTATRTSSTPAR